MPPPNATPNEEWQALAVQENLFALFRAMSSALPNGEIEEGARLSRHLTSPTNPMYKGVWATHLTSEEADAAIDETIAWFRSRHAPFFFWWTGPGTTPADLGERLQARGLIDMAEQAHELAEGIVSTASGAPGMVADLRQMNEAAMGQTPPGFEIGPVQTEADLQEFKQVLVEAYGMPEAMADGWLQAARAIGLDQLPWRMYLGRLDGKPVATNMLFVGGGVAGIFGVATIPSARGKGIGAAISLAPLLEAREMGVDYAVLFATEMAVRVYERVGFRLTGVRLNRYLWRNG